MENNNYINEFIHKKLGWNSTLNKCQSLINFQRMMILKENNIKNEDLLEKYYLNDDITNKQSNDVINNRIKDIFNLNNYEQNIKSEAWQKDLSKMFLGLNDENKGKSDNLYFEYNYSNRNKKKEGLIFIRNFFRKMKSAKKIKNLYNKKSDKKNKINNILDNYGYNYKFRKNKKEEKKSEKEKEEKNINNIWNKISLKYGNNSFEEKQIHDNDYYNIRYLTEIKKNFNKYENNIKNNIINKNIKILNLSENNNQNIKKIFPEIVTSFSAKNLKSNKNKNYSSIYRNKTFNEKLKNVYEGNNKYKYMTLNKNNKKENFDIPELLEHKNFKFLKKKNKIFLSPLHYSKYEQMTEIKNKLIKTGFLDKDVFKIYNKNL